MNHLPATPFIQEKHKMRCFFNKWQLLNLISSSHKIVVSKGMSKVQWFSRDIWIICAGFVAAMHVGKLPPAVPVLQQELGIGLVQAGLLLSLVQGAGMLFALTLGSYVEKIGLKRCVLLGLGLLSAASLLGGFSQSVSSLLLLRVVEGFGFLLVTLSGPAYIRQLVPAEEISAKMGLWSAYMGGGMGISLLLTPWLITMMGWQGVWLTLTLLTLSLFALVATRVPKPQQSTQKIEVFQLIKTTLKHPPAWMLALMFGTYAGQWFSLVGFLPTIYQQNEISLTLAGALTASVAIANAVGTFACGIMLQRGLLPKTLVQTGFIILMLCALSFYIFQAQLPFLLQFACVFSFSLFGGLVAAVVFAQALRFAPSPVAISATIGMILQCSATSQFLLPPAIAAIVSATGDWFWVGIVMAAFSAMGWLLCQKLFQADVRA